MHVEAVMFSSLYFSLFHRISFVVFFRTKNNIICIFCIRDQCINLYDYLLTISWRLRYCRSVLVFQIFSLLFSRLFLYLDRVVLLIPSLLGSSYQCCIGYNGLLLHCVNVSLSLIDQYKVSNFLLCG